MEELKQALSLLCTVDLTMDTIPVTGIDNQDKFVGCAQAVRTALKLISDHIQASEAVEQPKEEANG